MKPITIAGGGLAGLGLGIALCRRGVPVMLHEAGDYPRHRVCGEFISGIAPRTLETLGIADLFDDANRLRSTAWTLAGKTIMRRDLPEPALGISRYRIDRRMAERFTDEGGDLETRSRYRADPGSATGVVWACGRRTVPASPWLGLKIHARGFEPEADLEMHLGEAGYVGTAPVENGAVNACGLFRRRPEIRAKGPDLLLAYLEANGFVSLADRLRAAELDVPSFLGVGAFRLGRQKPEPGHRCTIGDAESMIAPFTGNGMTMALQSASLAIEPLFRYSTGDTRWEDAVEMIRDRLRRQFRRRLSASRLIHPLFFSAGGRRTLKFAAGMGWLPFDSLYRFLR